MANKLNLFRGVTYPFTYNHVDANGAPVDLTGQTVYFTVKGTLDDDDQPDANALIKKTITSHTNPAAGITNWTLSDLDMYIEPGTYYFDVIVENASGQSLPPSIYGKFIVAGHPSNRQTVNG